MNNLVFVVSEDSTTGSITHDREALFALMSASAEFLKRVAGIGTGAYLDMRQTNVPEYEEWRDVNFRREGPGSYYSKERVAYTEDELERIYGVLLHEGGNPRVNRLFDGAEIVASIED